MSPPIPQNDWVVNGDLIPRLENITNALKESGTDANSQLPVSESSIEQLESLTVGFQEQSENSARVAANINTVKLVEPLKKC